MTTAAIDIDIPSTRERVLREAARLFAIKGYYGTSTRAIAAAAQIQQPSMFHHFPSKDAIMLALIDINLDEPTAVAEREAASAGHRPSPTSTPTASVRSAWREPTITWSSRRTAR